MMDDDDADGGWSTYLVQGTLHVVAGVAGHVFEGPAEGPEAVVRPVARPVHQAAAGLLTDRQVEAAGGHGAHTQRGGQPGATRISGYPR